MLLKLFKEAFIFAFSSVSVNKFRTFLSLFGITIGIVSIISVFTVFDWMESGIRENIASLGDNTVYVQKMPWNFDPNINWWDMIRWPSPSLDDYEAVSNKSVSADVVCFQVWTPRTVKFRSNSVDEINVVAVTEEYERLRSFDIDKGRFFSQAEYAAGKAAAIVGAEVARRLFDNVDPVGKEITISGFKAVVLGVFRKEGKGGLSDSGMDEVLLVPMNFARHFINYRYRYMESSVMIRGREGISVQQLSDEVTMILRNARRLGPGEVTNFSVNQASLITQGLEPVFKGINIAGWIIGGFSILVGGFGIANIMFVSVRERTSIIGIQMALGAKRRFILMQFLIESVLLSLVGGILGLVIIFIGTLFVNYAWDLGMHLTAGNIMLAIAISGVIGIVAGFAPASSASRMNPVEAIGYSF